MKAFHLPRFDRGDGMNEHHDAEDQVVSNGDHKRDLDNDKQRQRPLKTELSRNHKSQGTTEDISKRVANGIAKITERDRAFAIAPKDELGVLEQLPA